MNEKQEQVLRSTLMAVSHLESWGVTIQTIVIHPWVTPVILVDWRPCLRHKLEVRMTGLDAQARHYAADLCGCEIRFDEPRSVHSAELLRRHEARLHGANP
jgi:hypothetical protein